MKFIIDSDAFKFITKRASVCAISKNNCLPIFNCIYIQAEKSPDKLIISAGDGNTFAELCFTNQSQNGFGFAVQEEGSAFIRVGDLKRLYQATGLLAVSAENLPDKCIFSVQSGKKKCEINAYHFVEFLQYPTPSGDLILCAEQTELAETFSRLSCCLDHSGNEYMNQYSGFNLDGKNRRIVALDGHRAALRYVDWFDYGFTGGAIVSLDACKKLSKIVGRTVGKTLCRTDGKFCFFSGQDYFVCTKMLEGQYMDVNSVMNAPGVQCRINMELSDLCTVAKEYASLGKEIRMFFFKHDSCLISAACTDAYRTFDYLPVEFSGEEIPEGLINAFNAKFISELSNIFIEGKINILMLRDRLPGKANWIVADDDGYLCLILPLFVEPKILAPVAAFVGVNCGGDQE